jgi:hypothetical protein
VVSTNAKATPRLSISDVGGASYSILGRVDLDEIAGDEELGGARARLDTP